MKCHVVPHFHYDLAWVKTEKEYLKIVFEILEQINLHMQVYPELTYVLDQGYYLQKLKDKDLALFNDLGTYIKQGRIEFVQGGYCAPDLNLVSERTLLANYQKNTDFAMNEFEVRPQVMWNIDAFGHHGLMPKLAKKVGCKYYILWRGVPEGIPLNFNWKGTDGTTIPSARFGGPLGYSLYSRYYSDLEKVIEKHTEPSPKENIIIPMGSDFAMPQDNLIKQVLFHPDCQFSTPSKFFQSLNIRNLPIVEGECIEPNPLCPPLKDCWSSRIELKKLFREKENDPSTNMDDLIYCSFHDLICGTAIDKAYIPFKKRLGKLSSYNSFPSGSKDDPDLRNRIVILAHPEAGDLYNFHQIKQTQSFKIPGTIFLNKCEGYTELKVEVESMASWRILITIDSGIENGTLKDKVPGGEIERPLDHWHCSNGGFSYNNWFIEEFGTPQHLVSSDGKIAIILSRSTTILSWGDAGPVMYVPEAFERGKHSYKFKIKRPKQ